jgi:hypothetical protein
MKTNIKVSFGVAALVAAGMIGFTPASADRHDSASVTVSMVRAMDVMVSAETPQELVWDMTYGSQRPEAVEETVAFEDSVIVDYTFG